MEFGMDEEEDCNYSCLLIISALIHLIIYTITLWTSVNERASMAKIFEVEEALMITFFQIFSLCFGACALLSLLERAWKNSYGYGEIFSTKLKSIFTGIFSLIFLFFAFIFGFYRWEFFQFHGLYFLLDGITCLLLCIIFTRRFQLINEFVHELLHANGMHWIPISEVNAKDLYKLQECDKEMKRYVNSSRFGPFHRHVHAFRHSEFYQLHKWIAQIERYMCSQEPKTSIIALVREMNERALAFKINIEDQERYKKLAALPFILMPIDPSKHATLEFEDEV